MDYYVLSCSALGLEWVNLYVLFSVEKIPINFFFKCFKKVGTRCLSLPVLE